MQEGATGGARDGSSLVEPPGTDTGARYEPDAIRIVTRPRGGWRTSACALPRRQVERIWLGYAPQRSPEVLFVPRAPNFFGSFTSTSHSGPWDYLQRVPLVFYGPGFIKAQGAISAERDVTLADLAPTLAELIGQPWPGHKPGNAIREALLPSARRRAPPRVIVTVVWDGGGNNVLGAWPDAWPELARLMQQGTSVTGATVGSSPSVTPAIHSTIGTGSFPKQHEIVGIPVRDGARIVQTFGGKSPRLLAEPTLADIYDPTTGNTANIGMFGYKSWHLGMMSHGAYLPGGDHDIAVLSERTHGDLVTNPMWYMLPEALLDVGGFEHARREVDLQDGRLDSSWMGREILDDPSLVRDTPVWVRFQTRLIKALMRTQSFGQDTVPDLFYVNYKQIDEAGHNWNMLAPEMREVLESSDDALAKIVDFLNESVGRRRWVLALTADHGQTPDADASGAWPISMGELTNDVAAHFRIGVEELIQDTSPVGLWLNRKTMAENDIKMGEVANFFVRYRLEDNATSLDDLPDQYHERLREPLFGAAFPAAAMPSILRCSSA